MIARAIVLVLTFVSLAKCARILAVFPMPSVSHQVVFRPITQELVRRGHEVVVITPDPAFPEGQAPVNLTEIDVHETAYEAWLEVINRDVVGKPNDFLTILEFMIKSTWKFFPAEMQTPAVQEIIHKKRGDFDLILTELCIRKSLGFSHIFKVPVIQISSLGSILYNDGIVGSETHPFLFPSSFNRRIYNLTLYEKFFQLWNDLRLKWTYSAAEEKEHELMKDIFGPDVPPLSVLKDNIHLTMLNIHPIWADNQPVPPSVVYIGSIHQKPPKPLPLEYQSYLDASKKGVVYVSFGTNATPSKFAPETVQILFDVLCKLPYDVLLKWDQDNLPVDCSNIKISKWFPQYDILRHPNVKLFITQGGLQSTEESLTAGVPMIGLPILGDQWFNTEKYAHHRIGTKLEWSTLDRESFRKAIDTIIKMKATVKTW
ncbi:UDP-glucosyltransferase 2-like isoform X2 [Aricia agestis]|uniref:UDP-glucosyltransferase 2-like isoform X2 n=1 Tax=Aricia agestis TaxID=91739 RepID=UPI001C209130|nr:UDP-glucosyltransferase 2-like isoform X2 [Aricia agestis]